MDVLIGSNTLRNTNGVFFAHGQDQVRIEVGETDGQPTVTMGMYMPTGSEVAKLEKNVWISNKDDRFELTVTPQSVKVIDKTLKNVVIELTVDDSKRVSIPLAKFYTSKGALSEATQEWWRVGNKVEIAGIDMDLEGGGIEMPD